MTFLLSTCILIELSYTVLVCWIYNLFSLVQWLCGMTWRRSQWQSWNFPRQSNQWNWEEIGMCTCMKLGVCSHCVYTTVESKIETLGNISAFDVPSKAVCHKCLIKHTCTCICACRIVVALEERISIYNFTRNPQELHQIETAPNPRGEMHY